jgi:hypothetical protein
MESIRQLVGATVEWSADRVVKVAVQIHHGWLLATSEGDVRF